MNSFKTLLNACRNVERLNFKACKIISDTEIKLDDNVEYNIKELNFGGTGHEDRSGWTYNKKRLENIVKAICNSKLKNSLNKIDVYNCEYDANKVRKMFKSQSVKSIEITKFGPCELKE